MNEAPQERDDIERALAENADDDVRFGSGVPEHLRRSDLDFIQMSGLTAPDTSGDTTEESNQDDLNPELPVSFYEEGVDDVDSSSEPLGTEVQAGENDEIVSASTASPVTSSIASLKEIVADLTRSGTEASEEKDDGPPEALEDVGPAEALSESEEPSLNIQDPDLEPPQNEETPVANDESAGAESEVALEAVDEAEPALPESPPEPADPPDEPEFAQDPPDDVAERQTESGEPTAHAIVDLDEPAETTGYTASLRDSGAEHDVTGADPQPPGPNIEVAESLLSKLEQELDDSAVSEDDDNFEMPVLPEAKVPHDAPAESDQTVYNRPDTPHSGHRRRRRRSFAKRIFRFMAYTVLLALLAGVGIFAYQFYWQQTASPYDVYRLNQRHFERGQYAQAAENFTRFAERYPNSPFAADALFTTAQSYEALGTPEAQEQAVTVYARFVEEYPEHPKVQRATTMLGLGYVKTANYDRAIQILGKPNLRKVDPEGYLAALRGLAEAHAALGQMEEARSAYLRAASLEGNYSADEDYLALAEL